MRKGLFCLFICIGLVIAGWTTAEAAPSKPTILISQFETNPAPIVPGEAFTLTFELENVGDRDARKVSIVIRDGQGNESIGEAEQALAEGSQIFSPVESGNMLYISKIPKGEKVDASIRMMAPGDIKPGLYNLDIMMEYGDTGRASYQLSQRIGLVVSQEESLKIVSLQVPSELMAGDEADLSAEIVNLGNALLRGIKVEVEGDLEPEEPSLYFGTFEAGDFDEYSSRFSVEDPGTKKGKVIVSYYDPFNKLQRVEEEFSIQVKGPESSPEPEEGKAKGGFWDSFLSFLKSLLGLGGGK
ncbi:MAG: COG1361 S-layer family protein [Clostridia bacterium]|jgi:hypothetical protein